MSEIRKNRRLTVIAVSALIAAAFICRIISGFSGQSLTGCLLDFIRAFIYIGLFSVWGISLGKRIVLPSVRILFCLEASLMVFLTTVRIVKKYFAHGADVQRYLWYVSYIPYVLIPAVAFLICLFSSGYEKKSGKAVSAIVLVPSCLLSLTVLTNDAHRSVFTFPAGADTWTESAAAYGPAYYIVAAAPVLLSAASVAVILLGGRHAKTGREIFLPLIPAVLAALYAVLYRIGIPYIRPLSDPSVFFCLIFALFFEICIHSELIRSNSLYDSFFVKSKGISAQITDSNLVPRYSTGEAAELKNSEKRKALSAQVTLKDGRKLTSAPVDGGYVLWTDKAEETSAIKEDIADKEEQLADRKTLLSYEINKEKEYEKLQTRPGMSPATTKMVKERLSAIEKEADGYLNSSGGEERKKAAGRISLLGSFVKRACDLADKENIEGKVPSAALTGALAESYRSLEILGIAGSYKVGPSKDSFDAEEALNAYGFFEYVAENISGTAKKIDTVVSDENGALTVKIITDAAPCGFAGSGYENASVSSSDALTEIIFTAKEGVR